MQNNSSQFGLERKVVFYSVIPSCDNLLKQQLFSLLLLILAIFVWVEFLTSINISYFFEQGGKGLINYFYLVLETKSTLFCGGAWCLYLWPPGDAVELLKFTETVRFKFMESVTACFLSLSCFTGFAVLKHEASHCLDFLKSKENLTC